MSNASTARSILQEWRKRQESGDNDGLRELIHPDFELVEPSVLPYGGAYRGPDGYFAFFDDFLKVWTDLEISWEEIFENEAEDKVAILYRLKARSVETGRTIDTSLLEVWSFVDGKVRSFLPHYYDTAAVAAALEPDTASG